MQTWSVFVSMYINIYPNHFLLCVKVTAMCGGVTQPHSALLWLQEHQHPQRTLLINLQVLKRKRKAHVFHIWSEHMLKQSGNTVDQCVFFSWLKYGQTNEHKLWFWSLKYKGWHMKRRVVEAVPLKCSSFFFSVLLSKWILWIKIAISIYLTKNISPWQLIPTVYHCIPVYKCHNIFFSNYTKLINYKVLSS